MTEAEMAEKAATFPEKHCELCGTPMFPKVTANAQGRPHLEARNKFLKRRFCSVSCRTQSERLRAESSYVQRALFLWRASFYPLMWPVEGCERAQAHYRVCLAIYREGS